MFKDVVVRSFVPCVCNSLSALGASLLTFLSLAPFASAQMTTTLPEGPLVVDQHSHVVVMESEAWFGPKAVTFQGAAAKPLLQSADMQAIGGGYDSADPNVIK